VLFPQDNAACHKSIKMTAKLHELGHELLPHPPYSPDRCIALEGMNKIELYQTMLAYEVFSPTVIKVKKRHIK
jgi:hypothetical protein